VKNPRYNKTTDDFTVTLDPDEMETMRLWLNEARKGIMQRVRHGYMPHSVEESLIRLETTLDQMWELKEWRKAEKL
jgi:hypothetical protein